MTVASLTTYVNIVVVAVGAVRLAGVVVANVMVRAGVCIDMTVELLIHAMVGSVSDVVTGVVLVLEFVVPALYFVEFLFDKVLVGVNVTVSAAVMIALEFSTP